MAVTMALCCLGFAALNDFVFKLYARKKRSRGAYVMVIGIVWTGLTFLLMKNGLNFDSPTLLWGTISGLFSVVANILLIESMTHQSAGTCATIYRLNLVAVVLGALLLLGESIGMFKLLGIFAAIVAIGLFYLDSNSSVSASKGRIGIYLAILAALLRAGMGLSYKYALMQGGNRGGILVLNGTLWIIGGMLYLLLRESPISLVQRETWKYGISSGILIVGIVFFMALALQYGDAGVVLPVAQMSFLITAVLGYLLLKEPFSGKKILGILAGVGCIILISFASK